MATLQNIRSKGPLLVIVIGLALFAFIAGDAWKVLQPHQSQDVGEIDGETISAQEYQALVEEYTEVVKFTTGSSAINEEQSNQIKDEVWRAYVNNKLIENSTKPISPCKMAQRHARHSLRRYRLCLTTRANLRICLSTIKKDERLSLYS